MAGPFEFKITSNDALLKRSLNDYQRVNIPFIRTVAATRTAWNVRDAVREEILRTFKNPVDWTLRPLTVRPARFDGTGALVYWEESGGKGTSAGMYLRPQVTGGGRPHTKLEARLIRIGVLAPNLYVVPGRFAQLNAKGNLNVGQIGKILHTVGGLAGYVEPGPRYRNRGKRQGEAYIVIKTRTGNLRPGIYQRKAGSLYPILMFVSQPHYSAIFPFAAIAQRAVNMNFARNYRDVALEVGQGKFRQKGSSSRVA